MRAFLKTFTLILASGTAVAAGPEFVTVINSTATPIPVNITNSISVSAQTVNLATAPFNGVFPSIGEAIAAVGPTGLPQALSVDVSSALRVSGTINATSVNLSSSQYNLAFPGNGTAISFVGPTGLTQAGRVSVSSDQWVNAMIVPGSNTVILSGNSNVNVTNPSTTTVFQPNAFNVVSTSTYVTNLTTVTFNGIPQPVTLSGNNAVNVVSTSTVVTISTNIVNGVAGSTVAVTNANGQNLNVNIAAGSIGNSGFNVNNTVNLNDNFSTNTYVTNVETVTFNGVPQPITASGNNAFNVVSTNTVVAISTNIVNGVAGSTIAVTNANGQNLNVNIAAGSIGNTGFNVNNTVNVSDTFSTNTYVTNVTTDHPNGLMPSGGYTPTLLNISSATMVSVIPTTGTFSYVASTNNFSVASNATDIAAICGNSSKAVAVTGVMVSCTQTTAGITPISILRYSTHFVGVWSTMTVTQDDPSYFIVESTGDFLTANPTVGTLVGHVADYDLGCMATGTATPNDVFIKNWTLRPKILQGNAQCLTVNLEGLTVTGGKFTVEWDWTEY